MRRRLPLAIAAVAMLAGVAAGGCGSDEEELSVKEGEPVTLDDLQYNVVISRFLNPDDVEDTDYLTGQRNPGPNQLYLGVFMQIENEGDAEADVPSDFKVVDTRNIEYEPVESESLYALDLGEPLAGGAELPTPDSTAASGPIQGSMVLFRLEAESTENRPLELDIPSESGEAGTVELDI